jgi:hypothetical protein
MTSKQSELKAGALFAGIGGFCVGFESEGMERQIHNNHLNLVSTDAYIIAQKLMKHPLSILNTYVFSRGENA